MTDLTTFAAWKWLARYAADQVDAMKADVAEQMTANDDVKKAVRVEGVKIADITIPVKAASHKVTSEAAFIEWAKASMPGLVETVEIPARVEDRLIGRRVADYLSVLDRGADPASGEIPAGVSYVPEQPATWPLIKFADEAGPVILQAVASRSLPLLDAAAIGARQ